MKANYLYPVFVAIILSVWTVFVLDTGFLYRIHNFIDIMVTMVFGSFIAGASSEGGGAIAFPVMTLIMDISPKIARNFSLAIQSIGMTAATLLIIGTKLKVEKTAILYGSLGGLPGIIISTFFLDHVFTSVHLKLFFVSFWLAFGYALYRINTMHTREIKDEINDRDSLTLLKLVAFGFIGGMITGLLGNGIDIMIFCLLTLHLGISEKVATPTSVILMTINTIIGLCLHLVIGDFGPGLPGFDYWLACIPVVVFGAPLGAWAISKVSREVIATILYVIIVVQFVGALYVIQQSGQLTIHKLIFSVLVFAFGFILFRSISYMPIKKSTV